MCQSSESSRTEELEECKEGWTEGQKEDSEGTWNLLMTLRVEAKFFFPFFLEGVTLANPSVMLMYIRSLVTHLIIALQVDDKLLCKYYKRQCLLLNHLKGWEGGPGQ